MKKKIIIVGGDPQSINSRSYLNLKNKSTKQKKIFLVVILIY